MSMDFDKLMQQAQQMQEQMQKAQEEIANETVEGTAGGGAVTVKATGTGKLLEIKIAKEAIDPGRPGDARGSRPRRGQCRARGGGRAWRSRSSSLRLNRGTSAHSALGF